MTSLKHRAYVGAGGSFGSSQMWFPAQGSALRADGCGAVAAADTLAYLAASGALGGRAGAQGFESGREAAMARVVEADRTVARVRHVLGVTGTAIARGLRRRFRALGAPFTARWYCPRDTASLRAAAESMLARDIPAILSIPPRPWGNEALWLYPSADDAKARRRAGAEEFRGRFGHYVTATACEDTAAEISSWGRRYYLRWDEYAALRRTLFGRITGGLVRISPAAPETGGRRAGPQDPRA
ncbi:MAG: hypothetical protein VB021_03475 [Oscillospiraceae bacterium]|nr:hypothetical protein [Oscillospiraceae bacterium]